MWEAAEQTAFLSLTNCFHHNMKGQVFLYKEGSLFCTLISFLASSMGALTKKPVGTKSADALPQHTFSMWKWERDQYTSYRMSTSVQKEDFDAS